MAKDHLDEKRSASFGRLVTRIATQIQNDLAGHPTQNLNLTPAQKSVLVQLEARGNRTTTLALRLGISKQATSKLVQDLEQKDLVVRQADPNDGRASIILFTWKGRRIVEDTVAYFEKLEAEIINKISEEDFDQIKKKMKKIADMMDPHGF